MLSGGDENAVEDPEAVGDAPLNGESKQNGDVEIIL